MNRLKFFYFHDHNDWGPSTHGKQPRLSLPHPLTTLLQQSDAVTSLLSLSIAAASMGASHPPRQHPTLLSSPSNKHHRRLASTGKTRRRLSDAREACSQPLCVISRSGPWSQLLTLPYQSSLKYCCAFSGFLISVRLASIHKTLNYFHFLQWLMQTSRS